MGWSASSRSVKVLNAFDEVSYNETGMNNVFTKDGTVYMYEIGRENSDGSIVGSVRAFEGRNGGDVSIVDARSNDVLTYTRRVGSFKIAANGKIVRFLRANKAMKAHAYKVSEAEVAFSKGAMFVVF